MSTRTRRAFSDEFKEKAVRLARESGRPIAQVARDLDIRDGLLHRWIEKFDQAHGKGMTMAQVSEEQAEIARLRRELKQARVENEILKKATAYFAKGSL